MEKNVLRRFLLADAVSMGASFTSIVLRCQFLDNIGLQINYSGTLPVGAFNVEVSADHEEDANGNVKTAGTWVDLGLGLAAPGSTGPIYVDLNQISAPYVRVSYVRTSGTGTASVYATAKSV